MLQGGKTNMKKKLIIPLLALTLIAGTVSPVQAMTYNSQTSKKYEIYDQERNNARDQFIKDTAISGAYSQAAVRAQGIIGSVNRAYFIEFNDKSKFGLYDPELGSFIVDCNFLQARGKSLSTAFVEGENDEAYYIQITCGNFLEKGFATLKVDYSAVIKVYKDVIVENGVKHLKQWEVLNEGEGSPSYDELYCTPNLNGCQVNDTEQVNFSFSKNSEYIEYWGGTKPEYIQNVNDYYVASNNKVYFLKNGNEVYRYDSDQSKVVKVGSVSGQGTEIYVTRDCKTAQIYNASKQLVGTVNL